MYFKNQVFYNCNMHVGYMSSGLEEKDDIFKIATTDENKTLV